MGDAILEITGNARAFVNGILMLGTEFDLVTPGDRRLHKVCTLLLLLLRTRCALFFFFEKGTVLS